jgi:hypothetical protein
MLSRAQKRVVTGAAILVIAVLFVVPGINVNRYKLSVGDALSRALGRQVTVQGVSIQTFPQPGLLLSGLVVADDPEISAEPMLRADEVLATIRVTSLWRGRLEIASLKLKYPSLNLVRTNHGRWNLESLLERARQIPSAPTAKTRPETRPRFPYIEADSGRINFKIGQEKKAFAFNDADFSLWLASEDEWRMRLKARPVRTDANLTDTGTIKVEGAWRRAASLHETPLQLRVWWDDGQLGQLTSLIYGRDRGWRGSLRGSAIVDGKPDDLKISTDARVDDFRRYDITTAESVSLQAHCDAHYDFGNREVSGLYCRSPLGGGLIQARGGFGVSPKQNVDLSISAENVSAQFLAIALRHAKKNVPEDLTATGMVSAAFTVRAGNDGERNWAGNGQSSDIKVQSSVLGKPLLVNATRWHLIGPETEHFEQPSPKKRNKVPKDDIPQPEERAFTFEPVTLALGGETPAVLSGWFGRENFFAQMKGEGDIERVIQIGRTIGLPTVSAELAGTAKGKLEIAGTWTGFALPEISGDAQLHGVTAKLNGVASPLKIQTAQFVADKQSVSLSKASGSFADVHSALDFSATWPRNCAQQQASGNVLCATTFSLNADQLNVDEINSLLNPRAQKRPWYAKIANTVMGSSIKSLPEIYANGQFTAGKLVLKNVTATHVSGSVKITPAGFTLDTVDADLLGGKFVGDIGADFSSGTPVYSSAGNLVTIGVGNVASLMHDSWGSGKITASYKASASGWNADDIIASAKGTAGFEWRDGVLHHINLDGNGKPLQFKVFAGKLELSKGLLTISESKLQAPRSIYLVSGTASLGRDLELKLTRDGAPSYSVSGTLERPKVSPLKAPETQAALKVNTRSR